MRVRQKKGSAREIERERLGTDLPLPPPFVIEQPSMWIGKVMKAAGMEDRLWEQALQEEWAEIVGEQVAAHTHAGEYAHGTLTLFVDSSPWLAALQTEFNGMILDNLQARFGSKKIKRITFAIDPN